jgi:hypothetical protein
MAYTCKSRMILESLSTNTSEYCFCTVLLMFGITCFELRRAAGFLQGLNARQLLTRREAFWPSHVPCVLQFIQAESVDAPPNLDSNKIQP